MDQKIQTNQKDKKDKAVWSLILGIVCIVFYVIAFFLANKNINMALFTILLFTPPLVFILQVVGLILGIMGIHSSKKTVAIIGMILCIIGLCFSMMVIMGLMGIFIASQAG